MQDHNQNQRRERQELEREARFDHHETLRIGAKATQATRERDSPRPLIIEKAFSVPLTCFAKGCTYPPIGMMRDINGDVGVCRLHAEFLNEEAGEYDAPIREAFREDTRTPTSFRIDDDGRTRDDGLSISREDGRRWWGMRQSNERRNSAIRNFAEVAAARRARARDRENRNLENEAIREAARRARAWRKHTIDTFVYPEFKKRVQAMDIERRHIHSQTQKLRWSVITSGGIWVPRRQENYGNELTRIWRAVESEILTMSKQEVSG